MKTIYLDPASLRSSAAGRARRHANREQPTRGSDGLNHASPLLGLAPGGVCHAGRLTPPAVRSYRTFSPLPSFAKASEGSALSLPGKPRETLTKQGGIFSVALSLSRFVPHGPGRDGGRYPPPRFSGARTFLPLPEGRERPSTRPAVLHYTSAIPVAECVNACRSARGASQRAASLQHRQTGDAAPRYFPVSAGRPLHPAQNPSWPTPAGSARGRQPLARMPGVHAENAQNKPVESPPPAGGAGLLSGRLL